MFLLIGQQLPNVVRGLAEYDTATIVVAVAITVGVVLSLRPLWLVLTQLLPRSLHTRLGSEGPAGADVEDNGTATPRAEPRTQRLTGREVVALSWSGTRGVISLAAIFTLPLVTESGAPFPDRDLLLFCTLTVVLVALVGQGLTFAPVVRRLRLHANEADQARLRNEARSASVETALEALDELEDQQHDDIHTDMIETMRGLLHSRLTRYQRRLDLLRDSDSADLPVSSRYEAALHVHRDRRAAGRTTAVAGRRPSARRGPTNPRTRTRPRGTAAPRSTGASMSRRHRRRNTVIGVQRPTGDPWVVDGSGV